MRMQSFTERMQDGRDLASAKRHRGVVTGKSAAGWHRRASNVRPADDWHEEIELNLAFVLAEAVNDVNYTGGNLDGCSDMPF